MAIFTSPPATPRVPTPGAQAEALRARWLFLVVVAARVEQAKVSMIAGLLFPTDRTPIADSRFM